MLAVRRHVFHVNMRPNHATSLRCTKSHAPSHFIGVAFRAVGTTGNPTNVLMSCTRRKGFIICSGNVNWSVVVLYAFYCGRLKLVLVPSQTVKKTTFEILFSIPVYMYVFLTKCISIIAVLIFWMDLCSNTDITKSMNWLVMIVNSNSTNTLLLYYSHNVLHFITLLAFCISA